MQPTATIPELLFVLAVDSAVVISALAIGWWFARRKSYLWMVLVPAPLFIPVVWGLHAMYGRLDDRACSDGDWFCFSPVAYHWIAWVVGWGIATVLLTGLGFVVALWSGAVQLVRYLRERRAAAVAA